MSRRRSLGAFQLRELDAKTAKGTPILSQATLADLLAGYREAEALRSILERPLREQVTRLGVNESLIKRAWREAVELYRVLDGGAAA